MEQTQQVILYTTNCPTCKMLESQLKRKQVQYEVNTDVEEMMKLGFHSAPILYVNGEYLGSRDAMKWVNNL